MAETPHFPAAETRQLKTQVPEMSSLHISTAFEATTPASELEIDPDTVGGNLEVERVMMEKGKPVGIIQVEMEETLGHYAEWLEIPTRIIRRLNRFPYSKTLQLHMKVKIPLDKISKEQFEETRFEYHKKIQEDFFSFYEIESLQQYHLQKGDNVWTLCNDTFEVPVWLLKKYNPKVDFSDLRCTQKLYIPVIKAQTPDTANIAHSSPEVPVGRVKKGATLRAFWAAARYLCLFLFHILAFILIMAHLLLPNLRWKTKKLFVSFRHVF
jgi:membrane-bound lytic murein transglycosylase D